MDEHSDLSGPSRFNTTAWSLVARAQDHGSAAYRQSIEDLCRNYWKPVYNYMTCRGYQRQEALDLTQEYFALFLEKGFVDSADRERGKFRTFMLTTVSRFLSKQRKKRQRDRANVSLNLSFGDDEDSAPITHDVAIERTPEDEFNLTWARTLIAQTLADMEAACTDGTKQQYYGVFKAFLEGAANEKKASYREISKSVGISEVDVTNYLHRGRNIFQRLLRDRIRQSVETESEVDEEIEALKGYFA